MHLFAQFLNRFVIIRLVLYLDYDSSETGDSTPRNRTIRVCRVWSLSRKKLRIGLLGTPEWLNDSSFNLPLPVVPLPYVINLTPQITMACKASKIVEKSEGGEKQGNLF